MLFLVAIPVVVCLTGSVIVALMANLLLMIARWIAGPRFELITAVFLAGTALIMAAQFQAYMMHAFENGADGPSGLTLAILYWIFWPTVAFTFCVAVVARFFGGIYDRKGKS